MKDIIVHALIVLFGIGMIIYTMSIQDSVKAFTACCFTLAWAVVLIVRIIKHKK